MIASKKIALIKHLVAFGDHELCYAISDHPNDGFVFGGTLVSIGDIGYQGRKKKEADNYTGNTHDL